MSEAFDILSDPKKRTGYDRFGQCAEHLADAAAPGGPSSAQGTPFDFSGFDWGSASTSTGGGSSFRDIFADLFSGGRGARHPPRPQPQRRAEVGVPLSGTFHVAITRPLTNLTV